MKAIEWFKKLRKNDGGAEYLPSPWGRFGISDEDVEAYLRKNDGIARNVPLQIAQKMLDGAANKLVGASGADALDLARAQGMMQGIAMVAMELAKMSKAGLERFKAAGGVVAGEEVP